YEEPYQQGLVIEQAGDKKLEDYQYDGNHCIATEDPKPWRKQLNVWLAYASFYNPINFVKAICKWKDPLWHARLLWQGCAMAGAGQGSGGAGGLDGEGVGVVQEPAQRPDHQEHRRAAAAAGGRRARGGGASRRAGTAGVALECQQTVNVPSPRVATRGLFHQRS